VIPFAHGDYATAVNAINLPQTLPSLASVEKTIQTLSAYTGIDPVVLITWGLGAGPQSNFGTLFLLTLLNKDNRAIGAYEYNPTTPCTSGEPCKKTRAQVHAVSAAGNTKARYAVFHLIPISLYRGMKTKYTVEAFPEGWNFYFPVYDGKNFTARELFERRLDVVRDIDPANLDSMVAGSYDYA